MENPDGDSTSSGLTAEAPPSNSQPVDRPVSARSNRDERLKLLKEKQNEERLKKLEELKEHALLAARLREEQDSRRKKHFEQLGKKDDERRRQAEERRRILDEERKLSLQSKFETKGAQTPKVIERKPLFAFGSCTPRLIENNVDGYHWKSQFNLNVTRESTMKSTSAHDLHSQTKMSSSIYEWNQQRTTFDLAVSTAPVPRQDYNRHSKLEPDRVFCGRRKTDLTPTLPIRRIDGSSRSTSRAGGSSGAVTPCRPPSSMTSSMVMTSSIHSQAPIMRPRNLSRKTRPVSVHITGISNGTEKSTSPLAKNDSKVLMKSEKSTRNNQNIGTVTELPNCAQPNKPLTLKKPEKKGVDVKFETNKIPLKSNTVSKKSEKSPVDTDTIRRAKPVKAAATPTATNEGKTKNKVIIKPVVTDKESKEVKDIIQVESMPLNISLEFEPPELENSSDHPNILSTSNIVEPTSSNEDNFVKLELQGEELVEPESFKRTTDDYFNLNIEQQTESCELAKPDMIKPENHEAVGVEEYVPVNTEEGILAMSQEQSNIGAREVGSEETIDAKAPKILTEDEAKAALIEKRRLAREVQQREAARLEEERLLEEEKQKQEIEEAERLAVVAREHEEERLRVAIEEQEKRDLEDKKRIEEEEINRLERENYEREAAREAERVRLEMEERLKREEEERLERKRRVEAIMSRTRKKETETAMAATTPTPEETACNEAKSTALNGIEPTLDQASTRTTINNLNNYNNNNDFSETLIDFGDMIQNPSSSEQSNNSSNDIKNSPLQVTAIANCFASNNEWSSRNFESYFNRLGSRIDQLVLRMDHLDNRINRFTSLVQGRLDNIENSLTTSKLKMDLWGEELNRIEEQLTRKWKNLESKFDLLVPSMDTKLETKLTLIQRDNRRHNEHLSSLFTGLGQKMEKSNERVTSAVTNFTGSQITGRETSDLTPTINATLLKSEEKLIAMMEDFSNKSAEVIKSGSTFILMSSKVSNMFEDLIRRTDTIQTSVKDSVSLVNNTRREFQDSFRSLAQTRRTPFISTGSMTSSETMSAVIVEALASVESMSTALGRRMAELSRSIEERFEMVSMTLNGFLESCIRIQDGAPLIEEHIASVLERILDAFDNNTLASTDEFLRVRRKLDFLVNHTICNSSTNSSYDLIDRLTDENPFDLSISNITSGIDDNTTQTSNQVGSESQNLHDLRTAEILRNSYDLTEEEKKTLWESLFPNNNVPD